MKPIPTWQERMVNAGHAASTDGLRITMHAQSEIDDLRKRCKELEAASNVCGSGAGCLSKEARIDAAEERCAELERGLADAAQSLETVASLSGRKSYGMPPIETYMETFMEVRAYAAARAGVAREVIDAAMKEQA